MNKKALQWRNLWRLDTNKGSAAQRSETTVNCNSCNYETLCKTKSSFSTFPPNSQIPKNKIPGFFRTRTMHFWLNYQFLSNEISHDIQTYLMKTECSISLKAIIL